MMFEDFDADLWRSWWTMYVVIGIFAIIGAVTVLRRLRDWELRRRRLARPVVGQEAKTDPPPAAASYPVRSGPGPRDWSPGSST